MADTAKGTTLAWGTTAVGKIESLSGPSIEHPAVDITDLDDATRELIESGVADIGEVTIEVHFEPDLPIHDQLVDDCIAGTSRVLQIDWSDGGSTVWSCNAFCTSFEPSAPVGEDLAASITFKCTSTLTIS